MSVSNLTNTKWVLNNTPTLPSPAEYYDITFSIYDVNGKKSGISLGESGVLSGYEIIYNYNSNDFTAYNSDNGWTDSKYRIIEITGGTDVTNPDLIAWLEQNATRVIPTKTFDLSTLQLSAGTHTIQVKARAIGYRDSNFSNSVSYEVSPPSGYQVTISNGLSSASLYDGQDNTGIFLGTILSGETKTYTITSGWIYLDANGYSLYDEDGQIQGNPFEIVGDTTLIVTGAGSND